MSESDERLLFEHLGEKALCYLLAADPEALRLRFEDRTGHPLSKDQETVLDQLVALDQQMSGWLGGTDTASEWIERLSSRATPDIATSIGNTVRALVGGKLPLLPNAGSNADNLILQLALDCYPALIVKEPNDPFARMRFGFPVSLFRHPLNEQFQNLAMQDGVLSRLFTDQNESTGKNGSTIRNTGQGGGHQLWSFAEMLLSAGWTLARIRSDHPSVDDFISATLESCHTVRNAIKGKPASVPVRIGLAGVLLPEGMNEIDFNWAKVRRADSRDEQFIKRTSLEGQLTTTNQEGQTVVINYSGDLVLELDIPYLLKITDLEPGIPWPEDMKSGFRAIDQAVESLRLGLLLSMPERRVVLHRSWQMTFDPMAHGSNGIGWSDLKQAVGLMPTQLTTDQVAEWTAWSKKIAEHRTASIGVAIRRMLAAVAERRSPDDVLVDSVIVWENLFGARTETTLRVTSSLAWLLGDSPADRKIRQRTYKKLYQLRSDVVHGNATVDLEKIQEESGKAVSISIDALRAIFDRRPELLAIKSSEERSLEILHAGEQVADPVPTSGEQGDSSTS